MLALPVTNVSPEDYNDEPFNRLKNYEILLEAEDVANEESILVFDSHYLNLEGMAVRRRRFFFLLLFCVSFTCERVRIFPFLSICIHFPIDMFQCLTLREKGVSR
jgi:hypothetical protein